MVMVDEIRQWPTTIRCFSKGSCHLTTDGLPGELHAFAKRIGLRREWFQAHHLVPHYDLTFGRREHAIRLGAVFVPQQEQAIRRRVRRAMEPRA